MLTAWILVLSARSNKHGDTEKKILDSSPILEAFGNAKTVRNNNSSRFGKYMEIHFSERVEIVGAKIVQYLLEKSRIVQLAETERNYHIFYQLLAAPADEKQRLSLGAPEEYHYLNQSASINIDGVDDAEDYDRMRLAMRTLGFAEDEQNNIMSVLASVLHIGNINFTQKPGAKGEAASVANPEGECERELETERNRKFICVLF